jgi:hypothetical protein
VISEAEQLLTQPLHVVAKLTAAEIPIEPGLYAWYREGRLFYVGESRRGVRSRLWGNHLRGNARGSTLRDKVAKAFGFEPVGFRKYGAVAEAAISRKLLECELRFITAAHDVTPRAQADLIDVLDPPLNDHPGESPRWRIDEVREILGITAQPASAREPSRSARSATRSAPVRRHATTPSSSPSWNDVVQVIERFAASKDSFLTMTGKPNRIVDYQLDRRVLVETETGVNWVQIAWIKTHWETFQRKRRIQREDVLYPGRRSAFMMALFRQVPGVKEQRGRPTYLVLS